MKFESMKRGLVSLGLMAGLAAPLLTAPILAKAVPQAATAKEQNPRERLKAAVESLNLSEDQKAKLEPMFVDARAKAMAVRDEASLSDEQKKTKIREILGELRKNVNTVLTPEQQAAVKAKMEEAKAKSM